MARRRIKIKKPKHSWEPYYIKNDKGRKDILFYTSYDFNKTAEHIRELRRDFMETILCRYKNEKKRACMLKKINQTVF